MSDVAALLALLARPIDRPREEDLTAREVWADLVEVEALAIEFLTFAEAGDPIEPGWADELEAASYGRDGWEARWPERAEVLDDCLDLLRRASRTA